MKFFKKGFLDLSLQELILIVLTGIVIIAMIPAFLTFFNWLFTGSKPEPEVMMPFERLIGDIQNGVSEVPIYISSDSINQYSMSAEEDSSKLCLEPICPGKKKYCKNVEGIKFKRTKTFFYDTGAPADCGEEGSKTPEIITVFIKKEDNKVFLTTNPNVV